MVISPIDLTITLKAGLCKNFAIANKRPANKLPLTRVPNLPSPPVNLLKLFFNALAIPVTPAAISLRTLPRFSSIVFCSLSSSSLAL